MPRANYRFVRAFALLLTSLAAVPLVAADHRSDFSVVLLPDTQIYSRDFPENYLAQTRWIRQQAEAQNIRFVIHLGDIVQDADAKPQWEVADKAHALLDGAVPYTVVPGNHEMPMQMGARVRDLTMFDRYFPPSRFTSQPWCGGQMEKDSWANNYCTFEAAGMKFLVLGLEHLPRDETLKWADKVVSDHPDHRVIVDTHWYLFRDSQRDARPVPHVRSGNNGQQVWEKFVSQHPNIFLVVCGHIGGVARLTSTNEAGRPVHQILTDFQAEENGGNGWLRILRFRPAQDRIDVQVYSPVLKKYREGEQYEYSLPYAMQHAAVAEEPAAQPEAVGAGQ